MYNVSGDHYHTCEMHLVKIVYSNNDYRYDMYKDDHYHVIYFSVILCQFTALPVPIVNTYTVNVHQLIHELFSKKNPLRVFKL